MVDFGSHTTRAGYAGEDCPRVVCPSFYGYTEDASSSTNGANGSSGDAMDVDDPPAEGAGEADGVKVEKKKSRKYYVGDDAVGVWRAGMEVDNFMLDGIGELRQAARRAKLTGSARLRTCFSAAAPYPARPIIGQPDRTPFDDHRSGMEHPAKQRKAGSACVRGRGCAGDILWLVGRLILVRTGVIRRVSR